MFVSSLKLEKKYSFFLKFKILNYDNTPYSKSLEHGVEALWTGQKNILLSCPQCLDSMLAPGFWNKVYK